MDDTRHLAERYRTPVPWGRAVLSASGRAGSFDELGVDCPFVFWHNGQFRMMYVGFDGRGYQTALASSTDLVHWSHDGVILARDAKGQRWDSHNAAGAWILRENDIGGAATLQRWDGRFWMVYTVYPGVGYETGPARIGLAWSEDPDLMEWVREPEPILCPDPTIEWERGGLYKGCLVAHGGGFSLLYNAKDSLDQHWPWREQIGRATSTDLRHWVRDDLNPLLTVSPGAWDSQFVSDPFVVSGGADWLMFYYGFDGRHARDGLAVSRDLRTWVKAPGPLHDHGRHGAVDEIHAHKPSVLVHEDVVYHFYTSVRHANPDDRVRYSDEVRAITLATSRPVQAGMND